MSVMENDLDITNYAIKGLGTHLCPSPVQSDEFSYTKVQDVVTNSRAESGEH